MTKSRRVRGPAVSSVVGASARKPRVITEPLARVIERDQQGIEVSQLLKEILAVAAVAHGIGEPGIEALENAGFEQKFAQRLRQVGNDLLGQVVRHLSRTTGEILQGIRVVASTIEPQAGQLQRDGPTFRAGM